MNCQNIEDGRCPKKLKLCVYKKAFPVFAKKYSQAMDEVEIIFASFQIRRPLWCQGWVVMPKNVKKPKSRTL
jgi:hypothetical protein